jgi:hypothetical protein
MAGSSVKLSLVPTVSQSSLHSAKCLFLLTSSFLANFMNAKPQDLWTGKAGAVDEK